jgi:hypothetical protein
MLVIVVWFYLLILRRQWENQTCLVPLVLLVFDYPWTRKSKFLSLGVRFPSFDWVISPAFFFSEASVLKTLTSLKKSNTKELHPWEKISLGKNKYRTLFAPAHPTHCLPLPLPPSPPPLPLLLHSPTPTPTSAPPQPQQGTSLVCCPCCCHQCLLVSVVVGVFIIAVTIAVSVAVPVSVPLAVVATVVSSRLLLVDCCLCPLPLLLQPLLLPSPLPLLSPLPPLYHCCCNRCHVIFQKEWG